MSIVMEWVGLNEAIAAIEKAKAIMMEEIIPFALTEGIQEVEQRAKEVCPVKTGALRASIQVVGGIGTSMIGGQAETCQAQMPYAGYVEGGTSKMAARRYMQQGMYSAMPIFLSAIVDRFSQAFQE